MTRHPLLRSALLALTLGLILGFTTHAAHGARRAHAPVVVHHTPLRLGSSGRRVADLQWLLAGHRPNVFSAVKGTYHRKPNGLFGKRTAAALYAYKYRLGYPTKWNLKSKPVAGDYLFNLLRGRKQRPTAWVAIAARRLQVVVPGATKLALKVKQLEIAQLGVTEFPAGSNRGPFISESPAEWGHPPYQSSTGAFGLAWCASFQQWAFIEAGYGSFADKSAYVPYIEEWAQKHGYLMAKAQVGDLVAFLDDGGHIGFVTKVLASGYVTVEGNYSDSVKEVYHAWNDRLRVFIALPGLVGR